MSFARTLFAYSLLALILIACGPSEPLHYHCHLEANRAIKRQLAYPSTFDEHGMDTSRKSMDMAIITGNEEDGWNINTVVIFGAQNAFGVQSDYVVWYDATVSPEGDCVGIRLGDFVPYIRP